MTVAKGIWREASVSSTGIRELKSITEGMLPVEVVPPAGSLNPKPKTRDSGALIRAFTHFLEDLDESHPSKAPCTFIVRRYLGLKGVPI